MFERGQPSDAGGSSSLNGAGCGRAPLDGAGKDEPLDARGAPSRPRRADRGNARGKLRWLARAQVGGPGRLELLRPRLPRDPDRDHRRACWESMRGWCLLVMGACLVLIAELAHTPSIHWPARSAT